MSTETCKLCHKDCTPWVHINGHICQDCYMKPKWISAKDRLPEEDKEYLVLIDNKIVSISHFYIFFKKFDKDKYFDITHWMSLPSPPESINET